MTVSNDTIDLSVDAAFYVLFIGQESLVRFPNAMSGEAFPQNLTTKPFAPENAGKSFAVDDLPDWLVGKLRVIEHLMPEAEVQKAFVNVTVTAKAAEALPDIFMVKTPILSDRAKAAMEGFSPGLAYFYPAHLTVAGTDDPVAGTYWSCMPKRKIFAQVKGNPDAPDYTEADGPTGQFLPALHWVSGALDYLADTYPLLDDWGGYLSMNQPLFKHLKAAGLTGLDEIPNDAKDRVATLGEIYKANKEFVSHVFWNGDRSGQPN